SCSSERRFTADFFQIPGRPGHPCHWLTATTAFAAQDFNPIECVHAWHTDKKHQQNADAFKLFIVLLSLTPNTLINTDMPTISLRSKHHPRPFTLQYPHPFQSTQICYF